MIFLILILLLLELLTVFVLINRFRDSGKLILWLSNAVNLFFSAWFWFILLKVLAFKGSYDEPSNIWMRMNLAGMITAVIVPRSVLCLLHFTGRLIKKRSGTGIRWMTNTGLIVSLVTMTCTGLGTFYGRFNFTIDAVTVSIEDLHPGLDQLRIVQISDLHLATFHNNMAKLEEAVREINKLEPDLLINTGDFISYGWREFGLSDTILNKARAKYGSFAVLGNHDMGTYLPGSDEAIRNEVTDSVANKTRRSGYVLLMDENETLTIEGATLAIAGINTSGRHPGIIHGDMNKALAGTNSADLTILLSHDPNQWLNEVPGKTAVKLTLSGHTHGMQAGIMTKKMRWSPAKYYYPHWNGLFEHNGQYHYVNRGLGVLSVPFRIWMPPEITVITLESE